MANVNETFATLTKNDEQVKALASSPYHQPASAERVSTAQKALEANGFKVHVVQNSSEALTALKQLIPAVSLLLISNVTTRQNELIVSGIS